ncbi:PQQ-binding-like beta-propeller repeat protein [Colwellia sp. UCD-KL20]|uniref:outer membrane protein assembly factor BamB family protein n=1 Tax=Colwellia sp. UCD-KL20 TaxID=1917165 RepID=UPI0009707462|nr:PQQ-binding-like beta-propeller repeat protein [Colwellia sp. UCD-KL20]
MRKKYIKLVSYLSIVSAFNALASAKTEDIISIDTGHTLSKIRTANYNNQSIVIASTYEGKIIAYNKSGKLLWENPLSGYMNHDIWSADLTNDNKDEILVANADGSIYCLSDTGKLLWSFKKNNAPMYAVTVIKNQEQSYIVAGGYDTNFYYIDSKGKLVKTLPTSNFSQVKPWGKKDKTEITKGTRLPKNNVEIANFLRPIKDKNGKQVLVAHTTMNSMQRTGELHFFKPLSDKPFKSVTFKSSRSPIGDLRITDVDNDGFDDVVLGSTKMKGQSINIYSLAKDEQVTHLLPELNQAFGEFGYRVAQTEVIKKNGKNQLFLLYGDLFSTMPIDKIAGKKTQKVEETLYRGKYSYNDLWKDPLTGELILASAQSGGSSFHIINTAENNWEQSFETLPATGKLAKVLENTKVLKSQVASYNTLKNVNKDNPVYLMSDFRQTAKSQRKFVEENYESPIFLGYGTLRSENYDRSTIKNKVYRDKRDKRQKYDLSQEQILKRAKSLYEGTPGAAFWGGHGNDPFFRSFDTHKKTLDIAGDKKTVMIFPELAKYDANFEYVLSDFLFPLADEFAKRNANIFLRNKHTFWQSMIYKRGWSSLISGDYADVFVPAMEETTDKSMDLSIAARTGLWASGAVNQWGTRFSRDNTSFDRLRQHSHQMVPNLALRQFVYHIANGATFINNFAYSNEYLYVLWDLIGKGILYTPKANEILSYSPVHLSMLAPDDHYVDEGNNVKWLNIYDQQVEENTPMVFSRLNGSWPGAALTEWDFSRYASGVKDRHLNYLPPQPNGMVLITPPQDGVFADKNAKRGRLADNLHPIYKNIMTEFYTNGRDYVSADGKEKYSAKTYYTKVAQAISEKSKLLPVTVKGDAAWVVAQIAPTTLRLTLVDGGYINPKSSIVNVQFNGITPVKVVDVIDNTEFTIKNKQTTIQIPTGLFKFIDIELNKPL